MLRTFVMLVALTAPAAAQSAEAEQLFQDGDRLMGQGKLDEACAAFEGSHRIEPRAGTLMRLGACRAQKHQLASAWSAYTDALARAKDPRKRELAEAAVRSLAPRVSKLTIRIARPVPGLVVTRDGNPVDPALWNTPMPVDGGRYEIAATAQGHQRVTRTITIPDEAGAITLELAPLARIPVIRDIGVTHRSPPVPDEPHGLTTRRKLAVALVVLGAGSLATGGWLGRQANSREAAAFALCPDPALACDRAAAAQAKLDAAHTRATLSNVMFGAGAVVVVGAAVLWFTGAPVRATVSSEAVGVAIAGGF